MITYLRFRKAMQHHGMMGVLPFRSKLQPYATYFALFIISILTLTNGFQGNKASEPLLDVGTC
jgi:amino acid transporter